jgi:hypothetical protein
MARLWRVALVVASASLTSCYEGWNYGKGGNNTLRPPEPGPVPAAKRIAYILFEAFLLDGTAMADARCFPDAALRQFRSNEWSSRIASASTALEKIAVKVVTVQRGITLSDCQKLERISNAAIDPAPWGGSESPVQDSEGRSTVHLKAVFWQGDPALAVPTNVTRDDWLAWRTLKTGGLNALSLHYFVVVDSDEGYFSNWRNAGKSVLDGEVIDPVNPTAEGISQREMVINRDTTRLANWVLEAGGS